MTYVLNKVRQIALELHEHTHRNTHTLTHTEKHTHTQEHTHGGDRQHPEQHPEATTGPETAAEQWRGGREKGERDRKEMECVRSESSVQIKDKAIRKRAVEIQIKQLVPS